MSSMLRWGILGTGNIARQFATGVRTCRRGNMVAVGSRTESAAQAFAQTYGIPAARGSYQAVINDPAVDAVYVALPNSMHHEWTLKALRAGKHVLCEKPFASNLAQSQEMFDAAEKSRRVLIEAFMYRSHPVTHAVLKTIREGAIGHVRLVRTSFCYRTRHIEGNIRFDAELAGGALMDIGCYCIDFSRLVAGRDPDSVQAMAIRHPGGVDEITVGMMQFGNGILASFTCGMSVQADNTAHICGTEGYIEVPVPWKPPSQRAAYTLAYSTPPRMDAPGGKAPSTPERQEFHVDAGVALYGLEADEFAAAALDGKPPMISPEETLSNMRILDEMRRQVGART